MNAPHCVELIQAFLHIFTMATLQLKRQRSGGPRMSLQLTMASLQLKRQRSGGPRMSLQLTMASLQLKRQRSGGPRMSLQLTFNSVGAMEAFKDRMERMKQAFTPEGAPALKRVDLLPKLLQIAEAHIAIPHLLQHLRL